VGEFLTPVEGKVNKGPRPSMAQQQSNKELREAEASGEEMYESDDNFRGSLSPELDHTVRDHMTISSPKLHKRVEEKEQGAKSENPSEPPYCVKPVNTRPVRWEVDTVSRGWTPLNVEVQNELDKAWRSKARIIPSAKGKTFEVDWDAMVMGKIKGAPPRALRRVANQDTRMSLDENSVTSPRSPGASGSLIGSQVGSPMRNHDSGKDKVNEAMDFVLGDSTRGGASHPRGTSRDDDNDDDDDSNDELNFTMESVKLTPLLPPKAKHPHRYQTQQQ